MQIHLESERMLLRRFTEADIADLAALHGDPRVMRYIGRPDPRAVVEEETLPRILDEYRTLPPELGQWAALEKETRAFLGWFSLRPATSRGLEGGTELGYRLKPEAWGRGYATEGARAVVRNGFEAAGVDRVVATTMTVNTASRRVLERTGLSLVRTFFEDWPDYIEGAEHGDVEYALERDEYFRIAHSAPPR
ncbi:GNAT family N-acetyltransferase [Spirillospora sp. NPDC050679]